MKTLGAMTLAAVVALVSTFAAGCDAWLTTPSLYNTIKVIVRQQDGSPVRNAPLTLYTGQRPMGYAATDSTGRFTFTRVPQGYYGVAVTRLPPFRDFVTIGDSVEDVQDQIIVNPASHDSVMFTLSKCVGVINAKTLDETEAPVADVSTSFYSPQQELFRATTGSNGAVSFTQAPCVYSLGVRITPPPTDSVGEGRGLDVMDGITVTNGSTVNLVFHVLKR